MKQKRTVMIILILLLLLLIGGVALYLSRTPKDTETTKKEPQKIETRESDIEVSGYQEYEYDDEEIHTQESKEFQKIQNASGSPTAGTGQNQDQNAGSSTANPDSSNRQEAAEGLTQDESKNAGQSIDLNEWR